jgi:MFS family permease
MPHGRAGLLCLIAANAISQLGNVVAVVALPWFVLETTGSAALTGVTAFCTTVPLALGAVFAGPVVDLLGARRSSILSDLGAALVIAGIPLLDGLGLLRFWLVLVLAFAAGALEAPGRTARKALLPELVERTRMSLERANSISTTSEHLGYVLGAPLAGVMIALAGAPSALWLDASSFLVSALLVGAFVPGVRAAVGRTGMLDGVRFVVATPLLRTFFVIWTVGGFLIGPLAAVVLPAYARQELGGAGDLAAAVTAYGVGGLVGTLAFGVVGGRVPRRGFFVTMWIVYPLLSWGLVLLPGLWGLVALLFAIGFIAGAYDPFEVTIHQELIPAEMRARAFAVLIASEMTVVPLSMLLYGFLIDAAGLGTALTFFAAGNLLLGAYAMVNRHARRLAPARAVPA